MCDEALSLEEQEAYLADNALRMLDNDLQFYMDGQLEHAAAMAASRDPSALREWASHINHRLRAAAMAVAGAADHELLCEGLRDFSSKVQREAEVRLSLYREELPLEAREALVAYVGAGEQRV